MATVKQLSQRKEQRITSRMFVEVSSLEDKEEIKFDALTSDISDSGAGLVTYIPLPVGTNISINIDGVTIATGEIIDVDIWECCGLARMGVRFIDTNEEWPLY